MSKKSRKPMPHPTLFSLPAEPAPAPRPAEPVRVPPAKSARGIAVPPATPRPCRVCGIQFPGPGTLCPAHNPKRDIAAAVQSDGITEARIAAQTTKRVRREWKEVV